MFIAMTDSAAANNTISWGRFSLAEFDRMEVPRAGVFAYSRPRFVFAKCTARSGKATRFGYAKSIKGRDNHWHHSGSRI